MIVYEKTINGCRKMVLGAYDTVERRWKYS